jgi:tetratricopeptide (TPR) repeat protein
MGDPLPTTLVAGISYKPIRPLLFSFDFLVPINLVDIQLTESPYFTFGFSAQFTSFLSMRMGIMGRAGNIRITLGSAIDLDNISLDINYTLDLLTQMQPLNRVSLGVRFNLGDGGRAKTSSRVDELYLLGLDSYALERYEEALNYWEEALRLDPRFEPAWEGISAIQGILKFQQRMRDMNTLN